MHTKELDRTRHSKNFTCYQCRRMDGHSLDECGEISLRCTAYKKMGHLARVCKLTKKPHRCSNWNSNLKSSKNPKRSDKKAHNLRAGWINEETSSDDEKEPVYSRNKQDSSVLVNLNGWKTKMIMDTACKYNIIFSELYKSQFKHYELKKTKQRFVAYGQKDALNWKGYFVATLKVGENMITAKVYVVEGHSESLLRRDSSLDLEIIKWMSLETNHAPLKPAEIVN